MVEIGKHLIWATVVVAIFAGLMLTGIKVREVDLRRKVVEQNERCVIVEKFDPSDFE